MSLTQIDDGAEEPADDGDAPLLPEGVLRGIEDIEEGNTASKEDLEALLNF
jgi:hypothetical protein